MKRTIALASLALLLTIGTTNAQTITAAPTTMNFQGRLAKKDGTPIPDGTHTVTFRIYDAQTAGNVKWAEQIGSLVTRNGAFSAVLGKIFPFNDTILNGTVWLEIQIENDAPLIPRQQFQSVAYALKANTVPDNAITNAKVAPGLDFGKLVNVPTTILSLPYSGTANTAGTAFVVTNNGTGTGVRGISTNGPGVTAQSTNGIAFAANSTNFYGILSTSNAYPAISGTSISSNGTEGISNTGNGLYGSSIDGSGVLGLSTNYIGVFGQSTNSDGVNGQSTGNYSAGVAGSNPNGFGVFGSSTNIQGVHGESVNGYGVFGQSINSHAGYFAGSVFVTGNVGIGNQTPNYPLTFAYAAGDKISFLGEPGWHYGIGTQAYVMQFYTDGSSSDFVFGYGNSADFHETSRISGAGDIGARNFYQTSDSRRKHNISPITNPLETVLNLRGVTFDWNEDTLTKTLNGESHQIGFIAQEIEKVLPELVHTSKDGYKSVAYANVVPVLVEAIKAQQKQIDDLKKQNAEIAELKAQVALLLQQSKPAKTSNTARK